MKIRFIILLLIGISIVSCKDLSCKEKKPDPTVPPDDQETTIDQVIPPFDLELPDGYKLIVEASGDLNKDQIEEKVIVINTGREGDFGLEREILIFKYEDPVWKLWHKSSGAVLSSEAGGVMGDPFEGISVERGTIVIKHFGGSRWKWSYTHRYRYQNETWQLIGATIENGAVCEEMENFDYNLSSGNVIYKKVFETCDDENNRKVEKTINENFTYRMDSLPEMDHFIPGSIYAVHPETGKCFPASACYNYKATNSDDNQTKGN